MFARKPLPAPRSDAVQARRGRYRIANTATPASLKPFAAQVAQPAGADAEDTGMNAKPDAESTATEWALLPVGRRATTL